MEYSKRVDVLLDHILWDPKWVSIFPCQISWVAQSTLWKVRCFTSGSTVLQGNSRICCSAFGSSWEQVGPTHKITQKYIWQHYNIGGRVSEFSTEKTWPLSKWPTAYCWQKGYITYSGALPRCRLIEAERLTNSCAVKESFFSDYNDLTPHALEILTQQWN